MCDSRNGPLRNMAAGRGAKANMAYTGPHWLKRQTLPLASGGTWDFSRGLLKRRQAKAHSLGLLTSWPLGLLASGTLALPCMGSSSRCLDHPALRPYMVGSQLLEAGSHTGMRASPALGML